MSKLEKEILKDRVVEARILLQPFFEKHYGINQFEVLMAAAVTMLLEGSAIAATIEDTHIEDTPYRVAKSYQEYFRGAFTNSEEFLTTAFSDKVYNQMVMVKNISFTSWCAHHLLPIIGRVTFAYIPNGQVVGLSKIPRFIHALAARPQVQEKFTQEIVDDFHRIVNPLGCGAFVKAYHFCMIARGVKERSSVTETTALTGNFLHHPSTKEEFLMSCNDGQTVFP